MTFVTTPRRAAALLVVALSALGLLVPAVPASSSEAVTFTVQGSIEMVASWGHTPDTAVELLDPNGRVIGAEPADAQGAVLFEDVAPGDGYRMRTAAGTSDAVSVIDPDVHPDPAIYEGIAIEAGYGYIPTRDGTTLSANVAFPDAATWGPGPWPTVMVYSGYDPSDPAGLPVEALLYVLRGYVVVGVNMRGSGCSGGAFHYNTAPAGTDGYDAVEAIAHQAWSNGRVGLVGISYSAISQFYVAATQPPHLTAITPLSPYGDALSGILYPGGIRNEGFALDWALDRQAAAQPAARKWARELIDAGDGTCAANQTLRLQSQDLEGEITPGRFYEDRYSYLDIDNLTERIEVPTYLASQFQDEQTGGSGVDLAVGLGDNGMPFRAVFANGTHVEPMGPSELPRVVEFVDFYVGEQKPDFSTLNLIVPAALEGIFGSPIDTYPNRFDGYPTFAAAKAAYEAEAPIRVRYEVGGVAGREGAPYATADGQYAGYPVPGTTVERWFLQPDGALGAQGPDVAGDEARATTAFRYDPVEGRASTAETGQGGMWKPHPDVRWETRSEQTHVTFTTPPATGTSVYVGRGSVDLWLRSSAADTDLEVMLTEVRPDGQEVFVQSGWLRASRRHLDPDRSTELHPVPTHREADAADLPAGELVPVRVATFPFAHVVRPGSRLRLTVEAPGGNQPFWEYTKLPGTAVDEIGHSNDRPSSLALPLLPAGARPPGLPDTVPSCAVDGVTTQAQSLRNQPCRPDRAPRRATAVTATAGPGPGAVTVTWSAPRPWADGVAPEAYDVTIGGRTRRVDAPADRTAVAALPPGVDLAATVTPVYGGVPGATSTPSNEVRLRSEAAAWVAAAWTDLTGLDPDDGDLAAAVARLEAGTSTRGPEAIRLAATSEARASTVHDLYDHALGRSPTPADVTFWSQRLAAPGWSAARAAAALYASDEGHRRAGGTDAAWVGALYRDALGRTAAADEVTFWTGRLAASTRGRVAWSVVGSAESARRRVAVAYDRYLDRAPSTPDVAFWAPRVATRGDESLSASLVASAEYAARSRHRFP